jgi:hypothetical protein
MSAAGTDSTYLRNGGIPAYGHSGLATMSTISVPMGRTSAFP